MSPKVKKDLPMKKPAAASDTTVAGATHVRKRLQLMYLGESYSLVVDTDKSREALESMTLLFQSARSQKWSAKMLRLAFEAGNL